MNWTDLIPILSVVVAVATFFLGRLSGARKDGEGDGALRSTIDHMANDIKEIKADLKLTNQNHHDIQIKFSNEIAELRRDVNAAFKHIDAMRGDIKQLQGYHMREDG